jgi:hypothetical protein
MHRAEHPLTISLSSPTRRGGTMAGRSSQTIERPDNLKTPKDPRHPEDVLYARSFLLIRLIVGGIGIVLPFLFIIGEWWLLDDTGVRVRGSLSAYYHSSMRDVFVAGLCVTGFFLATYMAGQANKDFWYSLWAGLAVFGVVFFPTQRPGIPDGDPLCGVTPMPAGCSPIQQRFGETPVATLHFICAAGFIGSLAVISFLFAKRDRDKAEAVDTPPAMKSRYAKTSTILYACFAVIVAAIGVAIVGSVWKFTVWELTPLYIGEVASVWAFGCAWFLKSRDLWSAIGHGVEVPDTLKRKEATR